MKVQTWHISIAKEAPFEEIKKRLLSKGLISVVDEAEKVFHRYTEPLNLSISFPVIAFSPFDLLSKPDSNALCYIDPIGSLEETEYLDLIIASENESGGAQLLADCESGLGYGKAKKGTMQETLIMKNLEENLSAESPHGRLLSNPSFHSSFEILYAPAIREQLRLFADTFGDSAVSAPLIDEILPKRSKLKKSEIHRLVSNASWFSKQFSIGCSGCGASSLAFSTREEALESLSHSTSRRCFMCNENTLGVVEAFALKEAILKGVTQGFWLEHLVHQVVQPVSLLSLVGQVVENFELDVVSLICERVILFECKDSSFGERDFWMSVPKAQALDANILWIVTTQPLHENVKRAIERQKGQVQFEIYITENLADQQGITSDISRKLEHVQNAFLRNLFTRGAESYRFHPSLRRRPLRRPLTR